jgi:CPA1 family monovalent cation:H+ antiporter
MQFWDLIDDLLNAMLFLVMGFALFAVQFTVPLFLIALGGIALSMVTRLISVAVPTTLVHLRRLPAWNGIAILTWGGLRGGISIAMALTLDDGPYRNAILAVCYAVVVWSILVQGLTMPALVRRLFRS